MGFCSSSAPQGAPGGQAQGQGNRPPGPRGVGGRVRHEAATSPISREHGPAHPEALPADESGGDPRRVWNDGADAEEVVRRIAKLPGFSAGKGSVVVAVLAKRLGTMVPGWERVAPAWFSLADVDSPEALLHYRELKRAAKKAGNWPPK